MQRDVYPNKEKIEILSGKELRLDGRGLYDFRDIVVEEGVVNQAEGSAIVKIGKSEVVAGVKMDLAEPYADSPEEGNMMVGLELTPLSGPEFEAGPPDIRAIELSRIIDRGIRESEFIDFKKLCHKKGEKVWTVFIDMYSLNADGNLLDAAALAAVAALKNAVFPKLEDDKVQYGKFTKDKLPLKKDAPITVTFYKVGDKILLDPTVDEEMASDGRISVTMTSAGTIHGMQKGGNATFSVDEVNKLVADTLGKVKEIKKSTKL